jgi:hypothetical protein
MSALWVLPVGVFVFIGIVLDLDSPLMKETWIAVSYS